MSLSYSAPLRLTRRLAPPMAEQGSGWIVLIGSEEAQQPWPAAPAFASTKWGLRGWVKSVGPVRQFLLSGVVTGQKNAES